MMMVMMMMVMMISHLYCKKARRSTLGHLWPWDDDDGDRDNGGGDRDNGDGNDNHGQLHRLAGALFKQLCCTALPMSSSEMISQDAKSVIKKKKHLETLTFFTKRTLLIESREHVWDDKVRPF